MHELDYVVAVDADGKDILASEYFSDPNAFDVTTGQETEFSVDDPLDYVVGVNEAGEPVRASDYYGNPTEFVAAVPLIAQRRARNAPPGAGAGARNPNRFKNLGNKNRGFIPKK